MAGLNWVGKDVSTDSLHTSGAKYFDDITNQVDAENAFTGAAVTQDTVAAYVDGQVADLASQGYVLNALSGFIQTGYLTQQLSPLIPTADIGQPNGVCPLGPSGIIDSSFLPSMGTSYILGPYGITQSYQGSTGSTPFKIADWTIGPPRPGFSFVPMAMMNVFPASQNGGRPVIEIGLSAGPASYSTQKIIARGMGRSCWNDRQSVTVFPTPAVAGNVPSNGGYPPTYNLHLSAWLWDANGETVSVTSPSDIISAGCYLIRYTL